MKKKIKTLNLKKEVISKLQSRNIKGGAASIIKEDPISFRNECRWSQGPGDFENASYSQYC